MDSKDLYVFNSSGFAQIKVISVQSRVELGVAHFLGALLILSTFSAFVFESN